MGSLLQVQKIHEGLYTNKFRGIHLEDLFQDFRTQVFLKICRNHALYVKSLSLINYCDLGRLDKNVSLDKTELSEHF